MHAILPFIIETLSIYKIILIARILLTWLPSINWYKQPFKFLRDITDPVLAPFSRLIPPIGGLDLSPLLLFLLLDWMERALIGLAAAG